MGDLKIAVIPYDERTDDQRLESNWGKAQRLFERGDWSACVMRAATSAEIAANIYIRQFLLIDHPLPPAFVNALLLGANGLDGKFKRLIRPAAEHRGTWGKLKSLQKKIESLNEHRNSVAHAGNFKSEKDSKDVFELSLSIIQALAPNESLKLALPFGS
jgi:hypothetical protein